MTPARVNPRAHARARLCALATGLLLLALSSLLPATAAAAAQPCPGETALPSVVGSDAVAAVRCLLNAERRSRDLPVLRRSRGLERAAEAHAHAMATEKVFAHVLPGGPTLLERIRATGYLRATHSYLLAENIGWGSGTLATPRAMVQAWMASPPHRANILRPQLRSVGLAAIAGAPVEVAAGAEAFTYVSDFARRARPRG